MSFLSYKAQKACLFFLRFFFFLFIIGCSCILTHLYVIKTVVRLFVWMLVQSKVTESPHSLRSYPLSRVQILLFRRMFLNHPLQSQSFFFPFGGSYNKATLCVLNSVGYILKTVYLSSRGKRSHTRKESQCYPISQSSDLHRAKSEEVYGSVLLTLVPQGWSVFTLLAHTLEIPGDSNRFI